MRDCFPPNLLILSRYSLGCCEKTDHGNYGSDEPLPFLTNLEIGTCEITSHTFAADKAIVINKNANTYGTFTTVW
jgi:hypothetical protein